jgi:hypothetical protein
LDGAAQLLPRTPRSKEWLDRLLVGGVLGGDIE